MTCHPGTMNCVEHSACCGKVDSLLEIGKRFFKAFELALDH